MFRDRIFVLYINRLTDVWQFVNGKHSMAGKLFCERMMVVDYSPAPSTRDTAVQMPDLDTLRQQQNEMLSLCRDNLNTVLSDDPTCRDMALDQLLCGDTDSASCCHVQHWAGGAYAYALALESLAPALSTQPSPLLQGAIDRAFGSLRGLCRTLQNVAPGRSGFVWLSSDREGQLQVNRTYQYATPLPLTPLLALPAGLFPSAGICEMLNFSTASRRYAGVLAQRSPNLYV